MCGRIGRLGRWVEGQALWALTLIEYAFEFEFGDQRFGAALRFVCGHCDDSLLGILASNR